MVKLEISLIACNLFYTLISYKKKKIKKKRKTLPGDVNNIDYLGTMAPVMRWDILGSK